VSHSASGPQDAAGAPQPASDKTPSRSGETYDRTLLESVLRQTLEENGSGVPLDDAETAALLQVAGRYRGQPCTLEPVAAELVQAVLQTHFQELSKSLEFWRTVSAQIAQTVFDDPVARTRLEELWHRLSGVT
jgi:hypothetical protein